MFHCGQQYRLKIQLKPKVDVPVAPFSPVLTIMRSLRQIEIASSLTPGPPAQARREVRNQNSRPLPGERVDRGRRIHQPARDG